MINCSYKFDGAEAMSEITLRALLNAAASSAMEGLPLDDEKLGIIEKILDGEMTLQDYFESVKSRCAEN